METSSHSEHKENQQITSLQEKKKETVCLEPETPDSCNEVTVEPYNLDSSTVISPSNCESEPRSPSNYDENDEDYSIFFTPELFEGEQKANTQEDMTADPPPAMKSATILPEERFEQGQGKASAVDGQNTASGTKDDTEASLGQKERIRGQKEAEEGEQVDNQSRQTDSGLCKLSGSREKGPSSQTGN